MKGGQSDESRKKPNQGKQDTHENQQEPRRKEQREVGLSRNKPQSFVPLGTSRVRAIAQGHAFCSRTLGALTWPLKSLAHLIFGTFSGDSFHRVAQKLSLFTRFK